MLTSTCGNISQLWTETGHVTEDFDLQRFIPVHDIYRSLSVNVCNALPTVHALTGCDTTSAIFWLGKKYVCNVITKNADICIDPDSAHWGNDIDEAVTAA